MSLLANEIDKNTLLLNAFNNNPFDNNLIKFRELLLIDAYEVELDQTYYLRPDKLAYEEWNQDLWYPAILVINDVGSVLEFNPDALGWKCLVPNRDNLIKVLSIVNG